MTGPTLEFARELIVQEYARNKLPLNTDFAEVFTRLLVMKCVRKFSERKSSIDYRPQAHCINRANELLLMATVAEIGRAHV